MVNKMSRTPATVAKKATAKGAAAKAAKPRKTAPKPRGSRPAKPVLLSGGNPVQAIGSTCFDRDKESASVEPNK